MRLLIPSVIATLYLAATQVVGYPTQPASFKNPKVLPNGNHEILIIQLKDGVTNADNIVRLGRFNITLQNDTVTRFAGLFNETAFNSLITSPDVESVTEDPNAKLIPYSYRVTGHFNDSASYESTIQSQNGTTRERAKVTQPDAPWGLARLSTVDRLSDDAGDSQKRFPFTYDSSAGEGVTVFVIDTGIKLNHPEFGGRAQWGAIFGSGIYTDIDGHGTGCASVIAGSTYGVAKKSKVLAVKVADRLTNPNIINLLQGLNWVKIASSLLWQSGKPSVVSMSSGVETNSRDIDEAVLSVIRSGRAHFVVSKWMTSRRIWNPRIFF